MIGGISKQTFQKQSPISSRRYIIRENAQHLAELIYIRFTDLVAERDRAIVRESEALLKSRCQRVAKWLVSPEVKDSLRLLGGVGTGKTTLLTAVKDVLWSLDYYNVVYIKAEQLGK